MNNSQIQQIFFEPISTVAESSDIDFKEFKIKETDYKEDEIFYETYIFRDFYGYQISHMIKDKIGYSLNGYINISQFIYQFNKKNLQQMINIQEFINELKDGEIKFQFAKKFQKGTLPFVIIVCDQKSNYQHTSIDDQMEKINTQDIFENSPKIIINSQQIIGGIYMYKYVAVALLCKLSQQFNNVKED